MYTHVYLLTCLLVTKNAMMQTLRSVNSILIIAVILLVLFVAGTVMYSPEEALATHSRGNDAQFIKFDGIDGEATDRDHMKWSELDSFSHNMEQMSGSASSRRRGGVIMEDVIVTKELDRASPKLMQASAEGKVFPKVEIHSTATISDEGRVTYYAWELKNVQVTSYQVNSSTGSVPVDSFSLNFEEVKVTYTDYGKDGSKGGNVEFEWKVEKSTK
jgi:type VI secretion system secreted protein Hcp